MEKIKTTQDLVEVILTENRDARNSDNILILMVYKKLLADKGMDVTTMTVPMLFANISKLGLPSIETIRRTRQKLQAQYIFLKADKDIAQIREDLQEVFRDYARE